MYLRLISYTYAYAYAYAYTYTYTYTLTPRAFFTVSMSKIVIINMAYRSCERPHPRCLSSAYSEQAYM